MDKNQALNKAMALCSHTEYSEADIRGKLKFWGADPSDIDTVIEQLKKEKFIDDLRFSTAYVRDKIRLNQWGKVKIRYMLSMDKVGHSIIDQALNDIDEEAYAETLKELLQKKTRELKNESNPHARKQKLIKFAQGRGFEVDLILRLLREMK
jgi:regulatory protein